MNYMTNVAFLIVIVSLVALLVAGTEDMGSVHTVFASGHVTFTNRGINVQTDTNQDQGCEAAGATSGITNACTATSGPGSMQTPVTTSCSFVTVKVSSVTGIIGLSCNAATCNNIGCQSVSCAANNNLQLSNCTTNNDVRLTSCTFNGLTLACTRTEPGTGITQSGSITGDS
jgi:hypothetical protein